MDNALTIKKGIKSRIVGWRIAAYTLMVIYTFLTIGPLLWLAYSSLKPHAEIVRDPLALVVQSWSLANYFRAWQLGNFSTLFVNSFIYSISATVLTVLFALMTGYTFAKFRFKISKWLFGFYLGGLLLTVHSVLVPLFVLETRIGIDDTRLGVIIPYIAFGLPFLVFLATSYIKSIPDALEEAAIIDGAGYLGIFRHVILPMCIPVTATMLIYGFLANWNEFVLVMILTSSPAIRSLPSGINAFAGGRSQQFGMQFAALMIGTIPILLFYAGFRKQIAKGFAAGSLKE